MKTSFPNSTKSCKISTINFCFLGSVILYKLSTTAFSDHHNLGYIRHRNIIYHTKAKVTFFLNNIKTQQLISVKSLVLTCNITNFISLFKESFISFSCFICCLITCNLCLAHCGRACNVNGLSKLLFQTYSINMGF